MCQGKFDHVLRNSKLIVTKFEYVHIRHIPRLKNQEDNDLDQFASGYKLSKERLKELIEVGGKVKAIGLSPSDLEISKLGYADEENFEILAINNLADTDWRKPIFEEPKYRALSYTLTGK